MVFYGYLPKLKRGLGVASRAHFLYDFPIKMFLIYYSINGQSFNVISFFFLRLPNKMCYSVLIQTADDVTGFEIYLRSTSKAMAGREKRRGRWKYKSSNISRTKRAF